MPVKKPVVTPWAPGHKHPTRMPHKDMAPLIQAAGIPFAASTAKLGNFRGDSVSWDLHVSELWGQMAWMVVSYGRRSEIVGAFDVVWP
jgi:hypothetical protein